MPELNVAGQRLQVAPASNLLDALLAAGIAVPNSCRAGSCHACLVRCLQGEPEDAQPDALSAALIATVCGVLAAVVPARRAASMDPAQAIRM